MTNQSIHEKNIRQPIHDRECDMKIWCDEETLRTHKPLNQQSWLLPVKTYCCRQNSQKGTSGSITLSRGGETTAVAELSSVTETSRLWAWTTTRPADYTRQHSNINGDYWPLL